MAYVIPSTDIQFFDRMNLTPDYTNSLYFATSSERDTYFDSARKTATAASCTYQRENRNFVRVEIPISTIYNCDYMRFRNPSFENKWFYAFVLEVNYINNITTEVRYQIDPLITWMGTFELQECYIERQHAETDEIGDNLISEGLPTGEYVFEDIEKTVDTSETSIAVVLSLGTDSGDLEGGAGGEVVNGIFTGCKTVFPDTDNADSIAALNTILNSLVSSNQAGNVLGMYMCPRAYTYASTDPEIPQESFNFSKPYTNLDGYTPKNKKCFIYPYKMLTVDNGEGQSKDFRYEFFRTVPGDDENTFRLRTVGTHNGCFQLLLYPVGYKKGAFENHLTDTLQMVKWPQCSWNVDGYAAYLAQYNASFLQGIGEQTGSLVGGMITAGAGLASAGIVGAGAGAGATANGGQAATGAGYSGGNAMNAAISGLASTGASFVSKNIAYDITNAQYIPMSDTNIGQQAADVIFSTKQKTFLCEFKTITADYAKMIDDYFTMYGYAQKHLGTPNMNARLHFTYVKTDGCIVTGKIPASDKAAIEAIFNNGCRFWKNHALIGDFSLDNPPLGEAGTES